MPGALKVRQDNILWIVYIGKELGHDLTYIREAFERNNQDGWTFYVIKDGSEELGNLSFEMCYPSDFDWFWKFTKPERNLEFVEIERR